MCVQAKSRQNQSRTLSLKQPVAQVDFAFVSDKVGGPSITLLNAVDVLTGLGLSVVVPTTGQSTYSQAELRRFILETGRTFGVLQCDPEPALKALAETATSEVGGLTLRTSPTGRKQAQGSVGNLQANLYAQSRALYLDLDARYKVELSVHDPLCTWLIKPAQWLLNRYLVKSDGRTPYEKRWGRKFTSAICSFAETCAFRKPGMAKAQAQLHHGIWLGMCTESGMHFCADVSCVYKTRTVRRLSPSMQTDVALLKSIRARPWDNSGSKIETDSFILPSIPAVPGLASEGANLPDADVLEADTSEPLADAQGELDVENPSGDLPAPSSVRRPLEGADEETFGSPRAIRRRLDPGSPSERKRTSVEEAETSVGGKVQQLSAVTAGNFPDEKMLLDDFRISAVTTKDQLEVLVVVNQDESELLLLKTLESPHLWYDTEFPRELELAAMTKEMKSMLDFDVFEEVSVDQLTQEQLNGAISSRWVKTCKPDGAVRCRLVVRGFDQKVEDLDDTFASTPSLVTLKLLLTLASSFNWTVTCADISTAFLHALITGEEILVIPPLEYYPEGKTLWKLKRALYGLRNAPRLWQKTTSPQSWSVTTFRE